MGEPTDVEQTDTKKKPRMLNTKARRLTLFVGLEMWIGLLIIIMFCLHLNTHERVGANTNSVQFFIGDGSMTLRDIQSLIVSKLEVVNMEMERARNTLTEAVEDLDKYDEEIQDIILAKIDKVTMKGESMVESADVLAEYMQEAKLKKLSLLMSCVYFSSYILTTFLVLSHISRRFPNLLGMFTVTMLGHILVFITIMGLYKYFYAGYLQQIHPDTLILSL